MAKRVKKFTAKKKKTLIPEPKWDRLMKAKTEEERLSAWNECEAFVHGELTDRERMHSMKKFASIELELAPAEVNALPDVYLNAIAKHGWKAIKLGYMPESVRGTIIPLLRDLFERADELRSKMFYEPAMHPSVQGFHEDHKLHPDKVKLWIAAWKNNSDDLSKQYVSNMQTYLKTGIWLDSHYGLNREHKATPICAALAYDKDGIAQRTKGVYYPDLGMIWKI